MCRVYIYIVAGLYRLHSLYSTLQNNAFRVSCVSPPCARAADPSCALCRSMLSGERLRPAVTSSKSTTL